VPIKYSTLMVKLIWVILMKNWLNYRELDVFNDISVCTVGICLIDPTNIIALSRPYEQICNDSNMQYLRESVAKRGWQDPHPQTLHLLRLPEGQYTVSSGGNHRAILSNELGLKEIKSLISVLIPQSFLNDKTKKLLSKASDKRTQTILKAEVQRLGWMPDNILISW
jgi:hypothetical protein